MLEKQLSFKGKAWSAARVAHPAKPAHVWGIRLVVGALAAALTSSCGTGGSPEPAALTATHAEAERWSAQTLQSLTLEQKIGQMICEQVRGEYIPEDDPRLSRWRLLARNYGIGGFVLYGGTPHDTARLLNKLQAEAPIPLLISADFEGGPGQQIQGATEFPANMAFAAAGSEDLAYAAGKAGAIEGRAIGIHLTYSPVVDVQTVPRNPVLGVRSFGRDIELLGRMAGAYIAGYQENGMLATAKHFPGRGDVDLIPGSEFTINAKKAPDVEAQDMAAFKKAIDAGVAFVMSEHIAVPSLTDGSDLPASVEKKLATGWLRDRLGFRGILTSDDMWYPKMSKRFGDVEACLMAIEAGHDIILKPARAEAVHTALVDAVRSGRIPLERIDASVARILYWKARLNLHKSRFTDESRVASQVGTKPHRDLLEKIADTSLTLLKNDGVFPMEPSRLGKVLHILIQKKDVDEVPVTVARKIASAFPETRSIHIRPDAAPAVAAEALAAAKSAGTVIVSLFVSRTTYVDSGKLREAEAGLLREICGRKPRTVIVMSYGNPYLVREVPGAAAFVVGYGEGGFSGNQAVYADSFIKLMKGDIKPAGRLPVEIPPEFKYGSGVVY